MSSQKQDSVQSVDRALSILETISDNNYISLNDLYKKVSMNKSTIFRLVNTLCSNGYIAKDPDTSQYFLTLKTFEVGIKAVKNIDSIRIIKSILSEISTVTNEIVHFVVEDNNEILCIEMFNSGNKIFSIYSEVGRKSPMYCTGAGKALLATYSNDEIIEKWNQLKIVKYTENTITDIDTMLKEVSLIRKNNYALDNEENEIGVFCVGTAILNYNHQAIGAISITTNSLAKIHEKGYADILVTYANRLSNLLGYQ